MGSCRYATWLLLVVWSVGRSVDQAAVRQSTRSGQLTSPSAPIARSTHRPIRPTDDRLKSTPSPHLHTPRADSGADGPPGRSSRPRDVVRMLVPRPPTPAARRRARSTPGARAAHAVDARDHALRRAAVFQRDAEGLTGVPPGVGTSTTLNPWMYPSPSRMRAISSLRLGAGHVHARVARFARRCESA